MKKSLFYLLVFGLIHTTSAQFGVFSSYASAKGKISGDGITIAPEEASGSFGLGLFLDLQLGEKVDLQPYIAYGIGEKVEDESNNAIGFGGNVDYYLGGRTASFFLRGGLGVGIALADVDTNIVKKSATSANLGLGIDLSDTVTLVGSYGTQLSNSSNLEDIDISASGIELQLQIKFGKPQPRKRPGTRRYIRY